MRLRTLMGPVRESSKSAGNGAWITYLVYQVSKSATLAKCRGLIIEGKRIGMECSNHHLAKLGRLGRVPILDATFLERRPGTTSAHQQHPPLFPL